MFHTVNIYLSEKRKREQLSALVSCNLQETSEFIMISDNPHELSKPSISIGLNYFCITTGIIQTFKILFTYMRNKITIFLNLIFIKMTNMQTKS